MCATLQRLNTPSEGNDPRSQSGTSNSWVASANAPDPDPPAQPHAPNEQKGTIFAIPSGPTPEDIPGFPFPPGSLPVTQSQNQVTRLRTGGIQPLPGMSIAPTTGPVSSTSTGPVSSAGNGAGPAIAPRPSAPLQSSTRANYNLSSGVSTDQLSTGYLDPYDVWFPEPRSIAETGLNLGMISDLVIKTMYFTSYMSGQEISASLRLPFYGVIDQVIVLMKKEQLCDVSGTAGLGEAGYQYVLTAKGMERAHQVLTRSSYVGPAPVPLGRYIEAIKMETATKASVNREVVERALRGMVLSDDLTVQVGAAVNAGKSLFVFGAPGNGKTLLADRIATMLGGSIAIPYSLEADGQVIQLFDLNSHRPAVPRGANENDSTKAELHDRRWVRIHRPVVVVGGELTLSSLDLVYNEISGFYEAPFQLKANGGLFLVDDFGRQQMSPQALLNRWIVPLEKSIDFLTLKTGKKLQVPFEMFLVLSTNLQPEALVDDAFLRRIQNKIHVPDPTAQQFYEIFYAQCKTMGIPFDANAFNYLVTKHYRETGRPFRASHPRDLLRQLMGLAKYLNVPPELTPKLLDASCGTYFVSTQKKK